MLSPYFQKSAEHVHVFASLASALALASASAVVAGNKYLPAKAVFAAVALVQALLLGQVPVWRSAHVLALVVLVPAFVPAAL